MDGTIYLDNDLFDGTIDFLNYIKEIGGRYMFMTNNSSKSGDKYIETKAEMEEILINGAYFIATSDYNFWNMQPNLYHE